MARRKIVFLIDTTPITLLNNVVTPPDYYLQLHYSALKIVTFFLAQHANENDSYGPVWGYKFYDSIGAQPHYGQHHFYDLGMKSFAMFEDRLKEKFLGTSRQVEQKNISTPMSQQLSCALADTISGFQWERPEFMSPKKSIKQMKISSSRKWKGDASVNSQKSNWVFLLSPCPSCCGLADYFGKSSFASVTDLQAALIKKELIDKIVNINKIALYWVDTGLNSDEKIMDPFHCLLSEVLKSVNGLLISSRMLFSCWKKNNTTSITSHQKVSQSITSCSMMNFLFLDSQDSNDEHYKCKCLSENRCVLLLKDENFVSSLSNRHGDADLHIPLRLIPATKCNGDIEVYYQGNLLGRHSARAKNAKSQTECYVQGSDEKDTSQGYRVNTVFVKGSMQKDSCYPLFNKKMQSYYCSFSCKRGIQERKESWLGGVYQNFVKSLFQSQLILILEVHDSQSGKTLDGCLHALSENCATISLFSACSNLSTVKNVENFNPTLTSLFEAQSMEITSITENACVKSIENEKLIEQQQERFQNYSNTTKINLCFMQSLEHWFCGIPHQSLSLEMHQHLTSLQDYSEISQHKTSQQSTLLLWKLKDTCKKMSNDCEIKSFDPYNKSEHMIKNKHLQIKSTNLGSHSTTYSQKLIAISKIVKENKQLEEERHLKGKTVTINSKSVSQGLELELQDNKINNRKSNEDNALNEEIFKNLEDLSLHLRRKIQFVFEKDIESFDKYSQRIANDIVFYKRKLNSKITVNEISEFQDYLDDLFNEFEDHTDAKKNAKVSRCIFFALLYLDIAVLLEASPGHWEDIADKVVNLFRRIIFLEDPSFISKYLNNVIVPKYKLKISNIVINIHEGLALSVPTDLLTPSKRRTDEEEGSEIIDDVDPFSCASFNSNFSASQSSASDRKLRRFSSVGDSIINKRQILVPSKKMKHTNVKKKISPASDQSVCDSNKEGWCRNLFDSASNLLKGSKKRKLQRNHSEIVISVKDTPAVKQRRHVTWKRQHGERRRSNCITDVTVIKESPLKDSSKEPLAEKEVSRLQCHPTSFNCKTSPGRFYSYRCNNTNMSSVKKITSRKLFRRAASCMAISRNVDVAAAQSFSKYSSPTSEGLCNSQPGHVGHASHSVELHDRSDLLREVLYDGRKTEEHYCASSDKQQSNELEESINVFGATPKRPGKIFVPFARSPRKTKTDDVKITDAATFANEHLGNGHLTFSEDSMDWISLFEKDHTESTERNLLPLPCVHEASCETKNSPDIFTPNREDKQTFSSPFLSVSSLETLENAPILSPVIQKSEKTSKHVSCRKKINILCNDLQ